MRRKLDFYETNEQAVRELTSRVNISGNVLEPCVGKGAIARWFPGCRTNDIDPAMPADMHEDACTLRLGPDWVVTNPPFSSAFKILQNFYDQGSQCAFLLRLSFLEPTFERGPWLEGHPPDGLIVLPRYSFTGDGKTDSVTCAWMLWGLDKRLYPTVQIANKQTGSCHN